MNKETQDQIAAVMLLHGTDKQKRGAIEYVKDNRISLSLLNGQSMPNENS